jgi:ribosomal peptide maturation radical SAM protein 1
MYRIALVNMPFAALSVPSIGLTQLAKVVEEEFKDEVSIDLCYLNLEFGRFLGLEFYNWVSWSGESHNSNLGDWFFREAAFPDEADNADAYLGRYFPKLEGERLDMKQRLLSKRRELGQFLDEMIEKYDFAKADLVGFTSMFSQNVASFAMTRKLKCLDPSIVTAMGGANCESPMGQEIARNVNQVDFVFSGSALKSFPRLVGHLLNDEVEKCHKIDGVFSKENHKYVRSMQTGAGLGRIGEIGEQRSVDVLMELDYVSYLDAVEGLYPDAEIEPTLTFETSRGCWWGERAHCTFCGLNGQTMAYEAMSSTKAINLIESIFAYYPRSRSYQCVDNIMPKRYVKEVFPFLNAPPDSVLFYEVKADLGEEELMTLSKARVRIIQPGIESLATSTLKLMKKGTNAFQNLVFLKNCLRFDICPQWNLLIGFPGEEEGVYKKYVRDMETLVHLPIPDGVFPVRFDRYSPYFMNSKEYGLDLHPVDFYQLIYPFAQESLNHMAYYFMDGNLSSAYIVEMVRWIDELKSKYEIWRARWFELDGKLAPKLFFKDIGSSNIVYDSRSGVAVEHALGDTGLLFLHYLNAPRKLSDISAKFSDRQQAEVEKEIGLLDELGLIFRENDRLLSLVLPEEPPRMTYR